ncbi:sugar ABC transporter ATP-binding protein [Petrotoga sp. 9PWA.NaAc.5.4]|uniref:sugar ABC transporter ATP-binding protein n=1 Tax=Petrotoga sp. 9PWA.NaAc.5.4 TaxID=1434328 RepID=UPI000CC88247|nr:sugar ABC transporter ATP-binding protein [Petrotoga sp. 9PWA.NaAc.5.4]PNR93570.1 D-ribose transporter ATP binding protein [Petrotoga sp. 9PWA.NaAc.5.4]
MDELFFEIKVQNLSKKFPGVQALKNLNMLLRSGEIHAIVGANGAGKSTFAKILSGVYSEYEGEIEINGEKVNLNSPQKAFEYGISTVYQEVDTALVPYFTASENLFLFKQKNNQNNLFVTQKDFSKKAKVILNNLEIKIDFNLDSFVSNLSVAEKQLLLISKALIYGSKFIIFDEPTASLGPQDVAALFETIRSLKKRQIGVLYISHRMPEVFNIADKITVFRDGMKIDTFDKDKTNVDTVVRAMLGEKNQFTHVHHKEIKNNFDEVVLKVKKLYVENKLGPLSFDLKKGEILGITGLIGAGKTELLKALFGVEKSQTCEICLENNEIRKIKNPQNAINNKIYMIPEERRKEGLIVGEDVKWNLMLPNFKEFSKLGIIKSKAIENTSIEFIQNLKIKCYGPNQLVKNLSGGNQQKTVIAKWLIKEKLKGAKVIIFDEPTVGIDIGTKEEIYQLVEKIAETGIGVIYASSDIDEILRISDRIIVMFRGQIEGILNRKEATSEKILNLATGGHQVNKTL